MTRKSHRGTEVNGWLHAKKTTFQYRALRHGKANTHRHTDTRLGIVRKGRETQWLYLRAISLGFFPKLVNASSTDGGEAPSKWGGGEKGGNSLRAKSVRFETILLSQFKEDGPCGVPYGSDVKGAATGFVRGIGDAFEKRWKAIIALPGH